MSNKKRVHIEFDPEDQKRIEELKQVFNEKTTAKVIKRLLKIKFVIDNKD